MSRETPPRYAQVAVPAPAAHLFTYRVPDRLRGSVRPGQRVLVPFGPRKAAGIVVRLERRAGMRPERVKEMLELLDEEPSVPEGLLALCLWVSEYYVAAPGDAIRAALPPGMLRFSRVTYRLTAAGREAWQAGVEDGTEARLLERLAGRDESDGGALRRLVPAGDARRILARLEDRGWISSRLERGPAPRTRWVVSPAWEEGMAPGDLLALCGRSKHRRALVEALLEAGGPVERPLLLKETGATYPALTRLEELGLVRIGEEEVRRSPDALPGEEREVVLNERQADALERMEGALEEGGYRTFLLQGVTGSGKTEVYLRAVRRCLDLGRTALVLVPEIGLTPAVHRLFRARFGDLVAVLHSGLSEGERYDEWRRVRRGEARVVVGARSAVFAPLEGIGLVVVDEEQEGSYKQEKAPRYNARDVAVMRASREGAACVLVSATPSLESYQRAESGRYERLVLPSRAVGALAAVELVDMGRELRETRELRLLSRRLRAALEERKAAGEQSILLLNRRGWAHFLLCRECGEQRPCPNCSVSLAVHRRGHELMCHYCDHRERVPAECPGCGGEFLQMQGEGTERLEERLAEEMPELRTLRLDRDVVRRRGRPAEVLRAFEAGEADVLLGTQMVAKGHDFPRVTLVGILSADQGLGLPDLRASERTFQLVTQVAGRAGRRETRGEVIVQAYAVSHYALLHAVEQDYEGFARVELEHRRLLGYPPFRFMIQVVVKDADVNEAHRTARELSDFVRGEGSATFRVLGPAIAPLARIRGQYRFQVLLIGQERPVMNERLRSLLELWGRRGPRARAALRRLEVDVDPLALL